MLNLGERNEKSHFRMVDRVFDQPDLFRSKCAAATNVKTCIHFTTASNICKLAEKNKSGQ